MEPSNIVEVERMEGVRDVEGQIGALNYQGDVSMRRAAAEALGQVGGVQAAESLVGAFRDPDAGVRSAAARALCNCRDAGAVKLLQDIIDDPDVRVRSACLEAAIYLNTRRAGASSGQQAPESSHVFRAKAVLFLLGAILWCIPLPFFSLAMKFVPLVYVGLGLIVFLLILGMKGWDLVFVDQRGKPSQLYKFCMIMLLAMIGIGLLPIFYWTGKGALRWYHS